MVIEDMQQSLELLENIKYFFYNIEEIEKKLNIDLRNKEYERDDLLHEIELSKLNAIEIMAVYKKLEKVLQERRIIKDKIDLVSTIKPYTSKFITKGICAETDTTIKNMNFRQIQEIQKINRLKEENECLTCEVVVVKEFKKAPVSIVQGNGGPIEMAQMAKVLMDVAEQLKKEFPEINEIIPMLDKNGGMKTAYKKVESWKEL